MDTTQTRRKFPKTLPEALQRGIEFVAFNDEPGELNSKSIRGNITVVALSEAFGYSTGYIAIKVKQLRKAELAAGL